MQTLHKSQSATWTSVDLGTHMGSWNQLSCRYRGTMYLSTLFMFECILKNEKHNWHTKKASKNKNGKELFSHEVAIPKGPS